MKDHLSVTITDFRGARHYSLTSAARRIAAAAVIGLGLIVAAGGGTIYWLDGEIGELEQRRAKLQAEHLSLREERDALRASVAAREARVAAKEAELMAASRKLSSVNEQLGELEIMIGLREGEERPRDIQARLDTARQTLREKLVMLNQVPSGYPVPDRGITSEHGMRVHPITGEKAFHNGVDLRGERGEPVQATADGVVEWAAFHRSSGLGKLVIVRHAHGFRTYYGHMSSVNVRPGDFVRRGDRLGAVGSTGLSSGPHLHYEVRHIYRKFDPRPFLDWSLENYEALFTQEDGVKWDSLARAVRRNLASEEAPRLSLRERDSSAN